MTATQPALRSGRRALWVERAGSWALRAWAGDFPCSALGVSGAGDDADPVRWVQDRFVGLVPADPVASMLAVPEHLEDLATPDSLAVRLVNLDPVGGPRRVGVCLLGCNHAPIQRLGTATRIRIACAVGYGDLRIDRKAGVRHGRLVGGGR